MPTQNLYPPELFEFPKEWQQRYENMESQTLIDYATNVKLIKDDVTLSASDLKFVYVMEKVIPASDASNFSRTYFEKQHEELFWLGPDELLKYFGGTDSTLNGTDQFHIWQLSKVHRLILDYSSQSFHGYYHQHNDTRLKLNETDEQLFITGTQTYNHQSWLALEDFGIRHDLVDEEHPLEHSQKLLFLMFYKGKEEYWRYTQETYDDINSVDERKMSFAEWQIQQWNKNNSDQDDDDGQNVSIANKMLDVIRIVQRNQRNLLMFKLK